MSITAVQEGAATEIEQWLARFDEALARGDAAGAAELFGEESFWRDLVAFTWNIKTVEGRDGRQRHARAHAGERAAERLARDRGADGHRRA